MSSSSSSAGPPANLPPRPAVDAGAWQKTKLAPETNLADPDHMRRARIRALEELHGRDRLWLHCLMTLTGLFNAGSLFFWQGNSGWIRMLLAAIVVGAVLIAHVGLILRQFQGRQLAFIVNAAGLGLMLLLATWVAWDLLSHWPWSGRFYSLFLGAIVFGIVWTNPWKRVFLTEAELHRLYREEKNSAAFRRAKPTSEADAKIDDLDVNPGWDEGDGARRKR